MQVLGMDYCTVFSTVISRYYTLSMFMHFGILRLKHSNALFMFWYLYCNSICIKQI